MKCMKLVDLLKEIKVNKPGLSYIRGFGEKIKYDFHADDGGDGTELNNSFTDKKDVSSYLWRFAYDGQNQWRLHLDKNMDFSEELEMWARYWGKDENVHPNNPHLFFSDIPESAVISFLENSFNMGLEDLLQSTRDGREFGYTNFPYDQDPDF